MALSISAYGLGISPVKSMPHDPLYLGFITSAYARLEMFHGYGINMLAIREFGPSKVIFLALNQSGGSQAADIVQTDDQGNLALF